MNEERTIDLHKCLIVVSDFLNVYIEFGIDVGLDGAVCVRQGDHAGDVAEIAQVVHADFGHSAVGMAQLQHYRETG